MRAEIGSEFERPSLSELERGAAEPPFPPGASLVGTGRDALSLVADDLIRRGINRIVAPYHHCISMLAPFERAGIMTKLLPVNSELILDGKELKIELLRSSEPFATLQNEAFGTPPDSLLTDALQTAESLGYPVIVDETHSLLAESRTRATHRIASLRKLLPLPDGGYVTGLRSPSHLTTTAIHSTFVRTRVRAAHMKVDYLNGRRGDKAHLDHFSRAESLLEYARSPSSISETALSYIERLDYADIIGRRRENAKRLTAHLKELNFHVVNDRGWRNSPAFIVITHSDVKNLRSHLTSSNIFCPIHWPRPANRPSKFPWRSDLLSLPIDHRYGPKDMDRIAETISSYRESGYQ